MRKALVVGINEYPGSARLNGCVNDAASIGELLSSNGDGSPNFDVMFSENVKTRSTLRSLILDLFKGDDDIALFFFSGHGCITDRGGYIVTPDFSRYDEGISMDEILRIVSLSKSRQKVVILDCCHAGAMGTLALTGSAAAFLEQGVVILASSRDTETSKEVGGHGVFTSLLINALKGGAADISGDVTPVNIYSYIDRALGGWYQRPVFKANIVKCSPLRKVKPTVELPELRRLTSYFPDVTSEFQLNPSFEHTTASHDISNVNAFKLLRRMQMIGLIEPVNEEYMYWAAMNHKSCRLTSLGMYYWKLIRDGRI